MKSFQRSIANNFRSDGPSRCWRRVALRTHISFVGGWTSDEMSCSLRHKIDINQQRRASFSWHTMNRQGELAQNASSLSPANPLKTMVSSFSSSSLPSEDSIQVTTIPKNNNYGAINLIPLIPASVLQTIRTLPEVEEVLSSIQNAAKSGSITLFDGLERASQIFQHVGEREYNAILLLKATLQSQHCQYEQVIQTLTPLLQKIENQSEDSEYEKFVYLSNLSKMHWYNGSFEKGLYYAMAMNEIAPTITSSEEQEVFSSFRIYLRIGCAMNAKALCTALSTEKVYDSDILRIKCEHNENDCGLESHVDASVLQQFSDAQNTLQMASRTLENSFHQIDTIQSSANCNQYVTMKSQLAISCASSYCNQGIIDVLHAILQHQMHMSNHGETGSIQNSIPFDSAMNSWRQGISVIDELLQNEISVHHEYLSKAMKAKMYCNMAWAILYVPSYNEIINNRKSKQKPLKEEELKIASKYSSLALKLYDEILALSIENENLGEYDSLKPIMGRALTLVASCYAKAGSAVTSEGLLQSAVDSYKKQDGVVDDSKQQSCPISQIDSRNAFLVYSSLCKNWEKRDADAKKHEEDALKINEENLVVNWRNVSSIYSGLSFFDITDF